MSNVSVFSGAGLPAVQSLTTALRSVAADVGSLGVTIIKMDKFGAWVYGADQTEVEDGSRWAVNPFSFVHGFIAWGDGEVLAERMVPITQPLPEVGPAPAGAKKGWESQVGCNLRCVSGEDVGLEARYSATSLGGKRAIQGLAVAIAERVEADPTSPVPVVILDTDHYVHKQYGKVFTPLLAVVDWIGMDGPADQPPPAGQPHVEAPAAVAAPAAADEPATRRRRRG